MRFPILKVTLIYALLFALAPPRAITGVRARIETPQDSVAPSPSATPSQDKPRLVASLGHGSREGAQVNSISFSANGKYLLTGSQDKNAILWDFESGKEIQRFGPHVTAVDAVALSPDAEASVAVTVSNDKATLWNTRTGELIRSITVPLNGFMLRERAVAFSPDAKLVAAPGRDNVSAILYDATTGDVVHELKGHAKTVTAVAFTKDGGRLVSAGMDGAAVVWDAKTGKELKRFKGPAEQIVSADISPDGGRVAIATINKIVRVWDANTEAELLRLDDLTLPGGAGSVAFSPDGKRLATGGGFVDEIVDIALGAGRARVWNIESGAKEIELRMDNTMENTVFTAVRFSPDGKQLLTGHFNGDLSVRDTKSYGEPRWIRGNSGGISSISASPDGQYLLTGSPETGAYLWDLHAGAVVNRYGLEGVSQVSLSHRKLPALVLQKDNALMQPRANLFDLGTDEKSVIEGVSYMIFSPGGAYTLAVGENTVVMDAQTGKMTEVPLVEGEFIKSAAFSPNEMYVLVSKYRFEGVTDVKTLLLTPDKLGSVIMGEGIKSSLTLHLARTGKQVRDFEWKGIVNAVAYSPNGRHVAAGGSSTLDAETLLKKQFLRVWDVQTKEEKLLSGHDNVVQSVAFSHDGSRLLSGSADNTARLWDVATGKELEKFVGHAGTVKSVAFLADPEGQRTHVATAGTDGTTRVWDGETGKELCRLISFRDGTWVVVDAEGRFDTNNLEETRGLHWIMPDDPLRPLPLEIFMRDYYEPRLLARVLAGEEFKAVRPLSELNRAQPRVHVVDVKAQANASDLVTVTVEVGRGAAERGSGARTERDETGVYDLRLFRDGQLVAQLPSLEAVVPGGTDGAELEEWRRRTEVKTEAGGTRLVRFENMRLPRRDATREVEFTAYAFNEDRVKSETARAAHKLADGVRAAKGRAYVVAFGVNSYDNPDWNLNYAANDARAVRDALSESLTRRTELFDEVVTVTLVSEGAVRDATKENVRTVLDLLAGKEVSQERRQKLGAQAARLERARPEDMIVLSFSGHGYAGGDGAFYVLPSDIGASSAKTFTPEIAVRSISSDELSLWLRGVDAGEMLMIIDACHAAAATGAEFKPGPMGSRGLGQLAYDKGMRILAATKAGSAALEVGGALQQGLLSYALVRDGLERGRANFRPSSDKQITLSEWLEYGVERVPKLYAEVLNGELKVADKDVFREGPPRGRTFRQQPTLFDFARTRRDLILSEIR